MKPRISIPTRPAIAVKGSLGYFDLFDPALGYAPMCGFNSAHGAAIWGTYRGYTTEGFHFLHAFLEHATGAIRCINARLALNDLLRRDGINARGQEQRRQETRVRAEAQA